MTPLVSAHPNAPGAVGEPDVVAQVGVLRLDGAVLERGPLRVAAPTGVRTAREAVLQPEVEQRPAGGRVVPVDVGGLGEAQLAAQLALDLGLGLRRR